MNLLWLSQLWMRAKDYVVWFVAGLGAVLAAVFTYRRGLRKAEIRGEEGAREDINRATVHETAKMEGRADEVRETISDLSDADLRERMRDEARRQSRR